MLPFQALLDFRDALGALPVVLVRRRVFHYRCIVQAAALLDATLLRDMPEILFVSRDQIVPFLLHASDDARNGLQSGFRGRGQHGRPTWCARFGLGEVRERRVLVAAFHHLRGREVVVRRRVVQIGRDRVLVCGQRAIQLVLITRAQIEIEPRGGVVVEHEASHRLPRALRTGLRVLILATDGDVVEQP